MGEKGRGKRRRAEEKSERGRMEGCGGRGGRGRRRKPIIGLERETWRGLWAIYASTVV